MHDRWRYVVVALAVVGILSVGVTSGYDWYRSQQSSPSEPSDCEAAQIEVERYTGTAPDAFDYENLSTTDQRQFDAARTAPDNTTRVDPNATGEFAFAEHVRYQNRTYFATSYLVGCPNTGPPAWVRTVLSPFFLITDYVRLLWLPAVVLGGIYLGWRKWTEWIRFD